MMEKTAGKLGEKEKRSVKRILTNKTERKILQPTFAIPTNIDKCCIDKFTYITLAAHNKFE